MASRSLLAIVSAVVALCAANLLGGWIATVLAFPNGGAPRLGWDLAWVVLGGVAAIGSAVRLAPCAPRAHAAAMLLLLLAAAVLAVVQLGGDWPWWFSAGILSSLPLQAWLGVRMAAHGSRTGPPGRSPQGW